MESLVMLTGSCLCGSVAYEVDAPAGPIVHCHCSTCRKTRGAAFSTVMPVPRESFRWLRGEELLSSFESSPGKLRRFCTRCGSHIVADRPNQPNVLLRLGCLDTPITDRPKLHMWRSEAASWYDPGDVLAEFPKAPS
jgi:hypothetical protein